eukprot:XP_001703842.1 Hypothetical protein GL50803_127067 [Giardia lamblia ATCC 50803]
MIRTTSIAGQTGLITLLTCITLLNVSILADSACGRSASARVGAF